MTTIKLHRTSHSQYANMECFALVVPDTSKINKVSVGPLHQETYVDRLSMEHRRYPVVYKSAFSFNSDFHWLPLFNVLQSPFSTPIFFKIWRNNLPTLLIIFRETRNLGKSFRLAKILFPKGGFLLVSISIRCGSAASNASILFIPPIASFRIATGPICAICFIWYGELSQTWAPKLRASSNACLVVTASSRNI